MSESAKDRMVRMLGYGKFGEELADEILSQYRRELAEEIRDSRPQYSHAWTCWGEAADFIDPDV